MRTKKRRPRHDELNACIRQTVIEGMSRTFWGYAHAVNGRSGPLLHILQLRYTETSGVTVNDGQLFEQVVAEAFQKHEQWLTSLFTDLAEEARALPMDCSAATEFLVAMSGIDFEDVALAGQDGVYPSGSPHVNTMILIPEPLKRQFEDHIRQGPVNSQGGPTSMAYEITGLQCLGDSPGAIVRGTDYVMQFNRVWPIGETLSDLERFLRLFTIQDARPRASSDV